MALTRNADQVNKRNTQHQITITPTMMNPMINAPYQMLIRFPSHALLRCRIYRRSSKITYRIGSGVASNRVCDLFRRAWLSWLTLLIRQRGELQSLSGNANSSTASMRIQPIAHCHERFRTACAGGYSGRYGRCAANTFTLYHSPSSCAGGRVGSVGKERSPAGWLATLLPQSWGTTGITSSKS